MTDQLIHLFFVNQNVHQNEEFLTKENEKSSNKNFFKIFFKN